MTKEFRYAWTWELASSPEEIWSLVSDANRFDRDLGLPPVELIETINGVRRVKFRTTLVNFEWEEEPFEWISPYRFGIVHRYKMGPIAEMRVDARLEHLQPTGTRLTYDVTAKSANVLGNAFIPIMVGVIGKKRFGDAAKEYDLIASNDGLIVKTMKGGKLSATRRSNLKIQMERLKEKGADDAILNRLFDFLDHADDLSLQRMKPYALADIWNLPRRAALETFLRATRLGVLDMYWDLLCPKCRSVTEDIANLKDVHATSHCEVCQIDFTANFDHNIEVIFRPNISVRPVDAAAEFCIGSPQNQPHIVFSMIVQPDEEMSLSTMLEEGRYFLRASGIDGSQPLLAVKDGAKKIKLRAKDTGWSQDMAETGLMPYLNLINETERALTFELVRTEWSDKAATAADVTTLQVFRDLFSSEVFRPGEEISIGSTVLMFTDLRNSTRLYREIGDASAFRRVREHFEILERAVAAEGGAVVKTIGDAIMATFRSPSAAIRAIWDVQKELTNRGEPILFIKVGIHQGPCILVNLNERLDYFGSTVNIASRLSGFSKGGEIIFSKEIHDDPEVKAFLEQNSSPNSITRFDGDIRGYDQPMQLWQVKMR